MERNDDPKRVENIFKNFHKQMLKAYFQGCKGECYVNSLENIKSALVVIGDFCFLAGDIDKQLLSKLPHFCIVIAENAQWEKLIEDVYQEKATKKERYALKVENGIFDSHYLKEIVSQLNSDYRIKVIDEDIYNQILTSSYLPFHDLCLQFQNWNDYHIHGLGFVIMYKGEIVAGASSYIYYHDGIEIEIDTRPDHRQRHLALICAAKLIQECEKRYIYPYWDAQNKISLSLAEKLGYHFDKAYFIYEITK